MKVSAFDDDPYFLMNLESALLKYKKNQCQSMEIQLFSSSPEMEAFARKNKSDIYLLDIATSEDQDCGIHLAKKIRTCDRDGHLIFMTSYAGRQDETYLPDIRPSLYLTKPISYEVLKRALDQIQTINCNVQYLTVRFANKIVRFHINDIICIERDARAIVITMANQQFRVNESLKSVYQRLNNDFIYIDKGIIINTKKVQEICFKEKKLILQQGIHKYFSRNYNKVLKTYFLA